jgi:tetratricopeptide (TPR) repeat protein
MSLPRWILPLVLAAAGGGCLDMPRIAAGSTAEVFARAQPSMKMEADWELAARAIPASLKTVEGIYVVRPDKTALVDILMEGYCQYASGFVEDEVEQAEIARDVELADYHRARATKMYVRCLNYALLRLGGSWKDDLFGSDEQVAALLAKAGKGQRTPLLWAAVGLASSINMNKDRPEMLGYIDTAKAMLRRVLEIDDKHGPPKDPIMAALPHIGMGMAFTGTAPALGGNPDAAETHFQRAIELTDGKFLLAKVYYARRVHFRKGDQAKFHAELVKVLETSPSIWPEQRLANEIAHRRARRYLKQEKELFP